MKLDFGSLAELIYGEIGCIRMGVCKIMYNRVGDEYIITGENGHILKRLSATDYCFQDKERIEKEVWKEHNRL